MKEKDGGWKGRRAGGGEYVMHSTSPASGTLMTIMSCHTAVGPSADLALVPALLQSIASICPRGQGARAYQ